MVGDEIWAEESAPYAASKNEAQPLEIEEAQEKNKVVTKEEKRKDRMKFQLQRRKNRHPIKVTAMAYYSYHIFGRQSAFSTVLRSQRIFQHCVFVTYCKTERESISYLP